MKNINYLIEKPTEKFLATPFHLIENSHFMPAIEQGIKNGKLNIEAIKSNSDEANFENTIKALESSSEDLDYALSVYYNLFGAHTNKELQAMSADISAKSTEFSNFITLDDEIFKRINHVYENKNLITDKEDLKLLEKTYLSFVRNGAKLDADQKEALRKIDTELSGLSPKFSENVLNDTNSFSLHITDEKEVEGLPQSLLSLSTQMAKDKNLEGWLFNLQYPSFGPFIKFSKVREYRQKVYMAFASRALNGDNSNKDLVKKIVNLRLKRAKLLGYKNHAEFVLEQRMAQKINSVTDLFDKLYDPSKQNALKEVDKVKALAKETDGIDELMPWDFSYYSEILKQKELNFDDENLRPYFEVNATVQGAFDVAAKLYDLDFKKVEYPTYHTDVQTFEVYSKTDNEFIGLFYADLFPRESKRSGAWATTLRTQGLYNNEVIRPHCAIVCNFSSSTEYSPSLLSLREVQTLFHEFGHALHMLLSKCKYTSLAGANVYWDFVELPSQVMENWVSEKECLDLFAKHYKTGESIPADYITAIKKSNQFMSGYASLRQLSLGAIDMAWHTLENEFDGDLEDFEIKAMEKYSVLPKVKDTSTSTAFGHLFAGGYSAGYYSYKWAEILDADAFEYFQENGIFNKEIASKFKSEILERGGTDHPMTLYKNFRGREPKPDALMKREGFS